MLDDRWGLGRMCTSALGRFWPFKGQVHAFSRLLHVDCRFKCSAYHRPLPLGVIRHPDGTPKGIFEANQAGDADRRSQVGNVG